MKPSIRLNEMFGLREKLSLSFAALLAIILVLAIQNARISREYSKENEFLFSHRLIRVGACDDIEEGVSQMYSGVLAALLGMRQTGMGQIKRGQFLFERGVSSFAELEMSPESMSRLDRLRDHYREALPLLERVSAEQHEADASQQELIRQLNTLMSEFTFEASQLEDFERSSILTRHINVEERLRWANLLLLVVLATSLVVAALAIYATGRWVLLPILRLTSAANEVRKGNFAVSVRPTTNDELGELTLTFNRMARELHQLQRSQKSSLLKLYRATQTIFESMEDAVALVSPQGEVERGTTVAAEVFGLTPGSSVTGAAEAWIIELYENARRGHDTVTLDAGHDVVQVFINGEEHFFYPSATPIAGDDPDAPPAVLLIIRDITLMRVQEELKHDAVATVSHQLKTPLTAIRMAMHLLMEKQIGDLNERQTELAETARDESDRLFRMVQGLLDMSRIKSGKFMLECGPVNAEALLADAMQAVTSEAANKQIKMSLARRDREAEIWADFSRIQHVFLNILSNAVKYTPAGGRVRLALFANVDEVEFVIEDSGPGIPPEARERIFQPFFRADNCSGMPGAGLGLAIAKQIIIAHEGEIFVEDSELGGVLFRVWLPRAAPAKSKAPRTARNV